MTSSLKKITCYKLTMKLFIINCVSATLHSKKTATFVTINPITIPSAENLLKNDLLKSKNESFHDDAYLCKLESRRRWRILRLVKELNNDKQHIGTLVQHTATIFAFLHLYKVTFAHIESIYKLTRLIDITCTGRS